MKNQVARNDPGNTVPAFWTIALPRRDHQFVKLQKGDDKDDKDDKKKSWALQRITRLKTYDWGNFKDNNVKNTVPSFVSWTTHWGPPSEAPEKVSIQNTKVKPPQQYDGNPIIEDTAHIEWKMFEDKPQSLLQKLGFVKDFFFVSDDSRTSKSVFAQIGFESNGTLWIPAKSSTDKD